MEKQLQEGWQCPVCKKILAPTVKMCKKCSKKESSSNDSDTKTFLVD